jgi:hypothetical protein
MGSPTGAPRAAALALSLVLLILLPARAAAQMLMPGGPGTFDPFRVQATWVPGSGGSPSLTDVTARGAIPLSRTETDTWTAGLYAADTHLGGDLRLAPARPPIPRDLLGIDANLAYTHRLEGSRSLSFTVGVGALSDEPFHSIHETSLNASGTYLLPTSGGNAWLLGLNFSNARPALNYVPLPIVAWLWRKPEHGLDGVLGIPFARLHWQPHPRWEVQLAAVIPARFEGEVSFRPLEVIRVSAGFRWDQQFWQLARRADTSKLLFYDSKRVEAGVEVPLLRPLALRVSGGYAFDRSFFEGTSVFERGDRVDLGASPFAAVTLQVRPAAARGP